MTNKQELQEQVEKLQKELDILKSQIDNTDKIDLFKITTYKQVCKALNEKEYKLSDFNNDEKIISFCTIKTNRNIILSKLDKRLEEHKSI